jgi:ribosomal protein S7
MSEHAVGDFTDAALDNLIMSEYVPRLSGQHNRGREAMVALRDARKRIAELEADRDAYHDAEQERIHDLNEARAALAQYKDAVERAVGTATVGIPTDFYPDNAWESRVQFIVDAWRRDRSAPMGRKLADCEAALAERERMLNAIDMNDLSAPAGIMSTVPTVPEFLADLRSRATASMLSQKEAKSVSFPSTDRPATDPYTGARAEEGSES